MENKLITLTTDFGLRDPYVGAMKGALLKVNPGARIIDISHMIGAQDILGAAFVLQEVYCWFPDGSVHVAVIDPGVGGDRAPIIIETKRHTFVGPDNGIFSLALQDEKIVRVIRITEREYFTGPVSSTFHGRDIFAPIAGHLSLGVEAELMGEPIQIDGIKEITLPEPLIKKDSITGEVIRIDNFGNLITNIHEKLIDTAFASGASPGRDQLIVRVKEREIRGILDTYVQSAGRGALCVVTNSSGLIEIALNMGSAAKKLRSKIGDKVTVSR